MPEILVVEDNEANRDMLSRRLQRRGFEVVFALDAATAKIPTIALTATRLLEIVRRQ